MGLDSVELVMAVEEKFGISISDAEACEILTVGELHRCVMSKLAMSDKSSCLSQRAFHLLRRNVITQFGIPRRSVGPDTALSSIIPRAGRRDQWLTLQRNLGAARWPALALSTPGSITLLTIILAVPALAAWYCGAKLHWNWLLTGFITMMCMMTGSRYFMRPFQTEFPAGFTRVRDLAYSLVAENPQLLGSERVTWTEEEVWSLLCSVINAQTGATAFSKDSRIVADLQLWQ